MEESNDSALKLCTLFSSDSDGRETFPENNFTNVGRDKQGNTTAETVAFLQELVEKEHDHTSDRKLCNN